MTNQEYTIRWGKTNPQAIRGTEASIRQFVAWHRDHDQRHRCVTSRRRANAVEQELERQLKGAHDGTA